MSRHWKVLLGVLVWPLGIYWLLKSSSVGRNAKIVIASVTGLLALLIIVGSALGGGGSSKHAARSSRTSKASQPAPRAKPAKVSNTDLHKRAQKVVGLAEYCLVELQFALGHKGNVNAMASGLDKAHSDCDGARSAIAATDTHEFSDEAATLFGAADEGKNAAGAGLDYLDTQYPSKLVEFNRHVHEAGTSFSQGMRELNARLSKLGEARVSR